ncbi:MAG: (Fe-S)-binding protein [Dehalococcoidia bacterium]|jgi:Fe-S oxidoreductase|nr:(Fe-S)-binding protein [Dehalococcoidia bacterium]
MSKKKVKVADISKPSEQMVTLDPKDLMPLPYPLSEDGLKPMKSLTEDQKCRYECSFDGICAVGMLKPESKEEEERRVKAFIEGLKKLLSQENNWTFLQPLMLSLKYCAKCQTCNDACPAYIASGKQEVYRPTYRSEVLRKIIHKYIDGEGIFDRLTGDDFELNWTTLARLIESAYRCTLCRRCAQTCPMGVDNGLISHELRKVFSQELGIAAPELHEKGSVQQLKVGSSTGMNPAALADIVEFMEEEIEEKTGKKIKIPVDKKGADILLIHNAGEYLSWPENPAAFAIIFDAAGINYTLSSDLVSYDAVNYGLWYDDFQLARVVIKHAQTAKELGVKKIMVGECGHAHKAMIVISDRVLTGELNVPRESCFPLLEEIVFSGKLKLDPQRNNFPVTLHDPCNMVRLMGIVEPQRRILRALCPQFREMTPHGVENYCCGGGSGFAIMQGMNFPDWKMAISGRMKVKQVVDAFQDVISPDIKKLLSAPCSNCKGQIRDLFRYYELGPKCGIGYTGAVEFIVNAMVDIKQPYLDLDELTA